MFTSIKISNYKSCKLVDFGRIGSVVVLVGRNGAGKSNILGAIHWAASGAVSSSPLDPTAYHPYSGGPPSTEFEIRLDGGLFRYELQIRPNVNAKKKSRDSPEDRNDAGIFLEESVEFKNDDQWETLIRRENTKIEIVGRETSLQVGPMTPCLPALGALLPPDNPIVVTTSPLISFLRNVRYYHFDEPNRYEAPSSLISGVEYKNWITNYNLNGDLDNSVLMRILHMKLVESNLFEEFESLLGPNGLELLRDIHYAHYDLNPPKDEDKSNPMGGDRRWHYISFMPGKSHDKTNRAFDFNNLSFGTRRIIRILASMVFDRSSVMLIEQPEDGIHPGLTKKVMGLLRDYADPLQLFISSHSLSVFNTLSVEDVRFVTMVDGETKLRGLTNTEIEAARKFISEEGDMADVIQSIEE